MGLFEDEDYDALYERATKRQQQDREQHGDANYIPNMHPTHMAQRGKQIASAVKAAARGDVLGVVTAALGLAAPPAKLYGKRTIGTRMPYGKRSYSKRRTAYRPRTRKVYRKKPVSYGRRRTYPRRKSNPSLSLIWKAMQSKML